MSLLISSLEALWYSHAHDGPESFIKETGHTVLLCSAIIYTVFRGICLRHRVHNIPDFTGILGGPLVLWQIKPDAL